MQWLIHKENETVVVCVGSALQCVAEYVAQYFAVCVAMCCSLCCSVLQCIVHYGVATISRLL